MEILDPPNDPSAKHEWALEILRRRSWWIDELSGVDVLRQAARILGEPELSATERYIQDHAPPVDPG